MTIWPVSSSAEEKPTREQLTVNPVGAAVTSRPANGAIDSSQQSEPELGEPQPASQALSHAEKLLELAAMLGGVLEEVSDFLHSLTFSLTSGRFRFCKKKYLFRGAVRVAPC